MASHHKDYNGPNPIPVEKIRLGTVCTVPVWRTGDVIDWALGEVVDISVPGEVWTVYIDKHRTTQNYYAYSINEPLDTDGWLPSNQLNWWQQRAVQGLRDVAPSASWYVGRRSIADSIEVLAVIDDHVWSFTILADGEVRGSMASSLSFEPIAQ